MLKIESLTLSPGTEILLEDCSWNIPLNHKIGLVGRNGTGKTTLIKNIMGEDIPYKGEIVRHEKLNVGYLPQKAVAGSNKTLWKEMQDAMTFLVPLKRNLQVAESKLQGQAEHTEEYTKALEEFRLADGFLEDKIIGNTLHGLGFSSAVWEQPCNLFSGGWQMRIALAKILLSRPDFAILDEPTNHLDIHARKWLADYLSSVSHGFIVVSHDRYFLDRITDHIVEIRSQRLHHYTSNYTRFLHLREERIHQEEVALAKLMEQKAHLQSYIDRFGAKATKARQAQSKKKQLEKLGDIQVQERIRSLPSLRFPEAPPVPTILMKIENAQIGWSQKMPLLSEVEFEIHKSMKIAVIGPNGCGKSTLFRSLIGSLPLQNGSIERSDYLRIGVFRQDIAQELPLDETPVSYLQGVSASPPEEIRKVLGGLGLIGEGHLRKISSLSGGERTRVALSQIVLESNNLLFLDEPTNHLDVESATVLSNALANFDGTAVIISHDRELIENCATHYCIIKNQKATLYDRMENWMFEPVSDSITHVKNTESKREKKLDYAERKVLSNKLSKHKKRVKIIEEKIETLEQSLENIDEEMNHDGLEFDLLQKLLGQREELDAQLNALMEEWEQLNESIEDIKGTLNP